jgi:hypothetical protein
MFFFAQSSTLNHKPQLGPQHRHHQDEVRKNGISYAVGLMRSIAYCRIRLVNRKTSIVAKMTPHVGISCELRKLFVRRCGLSCDSHGRVTIRPRVIQYRRTRGLVNTRPCESQESRHLRTNSFLSSLLVPTSAGNLNGIFVFLFTRQFRRYAILHVKPSAYRIPFFRTSSW